MMAHTRGTGEIPVPENESLEVRARVDFPVANSLVVLMAAALPLLAPLRPFNRRAYWAGYRL